MASSEESEIPTENAFSLETSESPTSSSSWKSAKECSDPEDEKYDEPFDTTREEDNIPDSKSTEGDDESNTGERRSVEEDSGESNPSGFGFDDSKALEYGSYEPNKLRYLTSLPCVVNLKVLIVGDAGAGKTAIVNRYVNKIFHNYHPTKGFHLLTREMQRDGYLVLNIIDVSGSEGPSVIRGTYYKDCTGVILAYNVRKKSSFDKTLEWIIKIRETTNLPDGRLLPCILMLTKCDGGYDIPQSTMFKMYTSICQKYAVLDVFKTSAKTNRNIEEAFEYLISMMKVRFDCGFEIQDARTDQCVLEDEEVSKTEIRRKSLWHIL